MLDPEPDPPIYNDDDLFADGLGHHDIVSDDDDDDDDSFDENTDLLRRSVPRRSNLGLFETVQRLKSRPADRSYATKIESDTPLENHEQEQLIRDLEEEAALMATIWRYLLILCNVLIFVLYSIFLLIHIIRGSNATSFHQEIEPAIGRGVFIVIQLLVVLSTAVQVVYSYQLPLPSEELFILSLASVIISTLVFVIVLVTTHSLSIGSVWMPLLNAGLYCITIYSERSTSAIFSGVSSLHKARYRYEEI